MSTTTNSKNNSTVTSNSRSAKKSPKKTLAPEVVPDDSELSSTILVDDTSDIVAKSSADEHIAIQTAEAVLYEDTDTVDSINDNVESNLDDQVDTAPDVQLNTASDEQVDAAATSLASIWELRKQAAAAEEALRIANDAINKISQLTEKGSVDNGFKPSSKKPFGAKPAYKSGGAAKPAYKSDGAAKPAYKSDGPKPPYTPKEMSEDEKLYRQRKNAAFEIAQDIVVAECVGSLSPKRREDTNSGLQYTINYRCTLVVRYDDDSVVADVDGEKFEYSRIRFLENRFFQNKVREQFNTLVPLAWVRFFPGRDENSFCIGLQRRREA